MTYELGLDIYAAAWIGVTGTLILMSKWLREKIGSLYGDFVDSVYMKNGDLGLDMSVDAADIARDYLLAIESGAIDTYAGRNDYPTEQYMSELNCDVGRPTGLILFASVFTLAIVLAFSGPLVYYTSGITFAPEYLVALYALVGVNLIAYLII